VGPSGGAVRRSRQRKRTAPWKGNGRRRKPSWVPSATRSGARGNGSERLHGRARLPTAEALVGRFGGVVRRSRQRERTAPWKGRCRGSEPLRVDSAMAPRPLIEGESDLGGTLRPGVAGG